MRKYWMIVLCAALLLPRFAAAESKTAKAELLMPAGSAAVLSEQNASDPLPVAGLTKLPAILTLCRAFDTGLIAPDTEMEVSKKASKVSGPTAFLEAGERVRAEELIKAAVMISAGDAITALMENAFGSEEVFLNNIGVILKEAGVDVAMENSLGTGTLFSCEDLIKLGNAALSSKTYLDYSGRYMDELPHAGRSDTELANANRMVRSYSGCFGLLTGSSKTDGYCGLFAAKRNDMTYLCAVIGSPTSEARFSEATKLFDNAFANYRLETPATANEPLLTDVPVLYGDQKSVNLVPLETTVYLMNKADGGIVTQFEVPETLLAPLDPAVSVGTATFYDAGGNCSARCRSIRTRRSIRTGLRTSSGGFAERILRAEM